METIISQTTLQIIIRLNRTMQYGNDLFEEAKKEYREASLNRTMQYGNKKEILAITSFDEFKSHYVVWKPTCTFVVCVECCV